MKKILTILMLLPLFATGQQATQQIDSIVQTKFNNGPAASFLVTKDFQPVYSKVKVMADLENNIQATELNKFRIGSVTKQFTAIAILKLMEEQKLSIEDDIRLYLPHFPVKAHPIKIKHLLTHTSGLPEITNMEVFFEQLMKNGCDPDSLINYFKDLPLQFVPGSKFEYNNSGYHMLGLIVEKASGMKYDEFITKKLLSKANMENTMADSGSKIIKNRSRGYEEMDGEIINALYIDMSVPFSAGNLLSTAEDLNKWYKALFEYKIVSKESLGKAHSPYKLNDGSLSVYGYGWFVDSLQGEKIIFHEGGINGFLSSVWFVPAQQTLAVTLSACMCNPTTILTKKILAHAIGKPLAKKVKVQLSEKVLKRYTGSYDMNGEEWTISIQDETLMFRFPSGNGHKIFALSEHEFFDEEWDSNFLFVELDHGVELHFTYLGTEIIGKRIASE